MRERPWSPERSIPPEERAGTEGGLWGWRGPHRSDHLEGGVMGDCCPPWGFWSSYFAFPFPSPWPVGGVRYGGKSTGFGVKPRCRS